MQVDELADVAPAQPGAHVGGVGRHVSTWVATVDAPTEHVGGVGWGDEYAVVGGARHAEDAILH